MIRLENINKDFKPDAFGPVFKALKNVSFEIKEGKITGFLGANGAGKTTSMKIIMDFIRPSSGNIIYDVKLGKKKEEIFSKIGFLPERPYFYPHLNGRDFVYYMATLSGVPKLLLKERIAYWAPRFKIDFALDRKIKTYSKGMLQRLGFLSTLSHDPSLIILDEPLSGLDPIGRKEMKDVIVEIHRSGKTVFFSSHIMGDVEEICQEIVFLQSGELQYTGSVAALLHRNRNENYLFCVKNNDRYDLKTPHTSSTRGREDTIYFEVSADDKNIMLKELVENRMEIISMEPVQKTLEEIFYGAKK
ncbi:MAG: ABC transporter ATP-binding protein [Bacteriovoracaceae bacterium]|nr:ABC transporter ATP-binding protein [Bacteriovoracaceae bacterium]